MCDAGRGDRDDINFAIEGAVVGARDRIEARGELGRALAIDIHYVCEFDPGDRGVLRRVKAAQAARSDYGGTNFRHGRTP